MSAPKAGCPDCLRSYEVDPFHLDCTSDSAPWSDILAEREFRQYAASNGQVKCWLPHGPARVDTGCEGCGAAL